MCSRRSVVFGIAALAGDGSARADAHREFTAEAFAMRDEAVRAGDQAYGAVVVKQGRIVGRAPSRVIAKKDDNAHAEREAIKDAQARLGGDLSACVTYSSSRPCAACERAASLARIERMYFGREPTDAGPPRATR
jgi:tRNA(Arg) A34 adenosine deaminase TadA